MSARRPYDGHTAFNGHALRTGIGRQTPVSRKGQVSKTRVKLAAREIFADVGYSQARITDIMAKAGLSSGAFYRYYDDKYDVLLDLLGDLFTDIFAVSYSPWRPERPLVSVMQTTEQYLKFYQSNADMLKTLIEVAQTDPIVDAAWDEARQQFYRRIERMLERGIRQDIVRPDVIPSIAAGLLGGMAEHYAYLAYVQGRRQDDLSTVVDQIAGIWAGGVFRASIPAHE
jgi:AcrR family transcriptional regulator